MPASAAAVDLALAAHAVHALVAQQPRAALWSPGCERWGIALLRGGDRAVIALDGCLAIAFELAPWRLLGPIDLTALARRLAGAFRCAAIGGVTSFAWAPPDGPSGACCLLIASEELPWLAGEQRATPATTTTWEAR